MMLSGRSVVSFSFDVGSERMEMSVHSPTPLNNDQWHRVEAEKNIKEAVLQLDGQFREVRTTPPQGHTKLEFYSELYVGETHTHTHTGIHKYTNAHTNTCTHKDIHTYTHTGMHTYTLTPMHTH